jgi:ABC-type dipeptide/oligopeptide/nickel transport system permease subunit
MQAITHEFEEPTGETVAARGAWEEFWRRFRRDRVALASAFFLIGLTLLAFIGAPLASHLSGHAFDQQFNNALDLNGIPLGPLEYEFAADGSGPNPAGEFFVLGSDRLGRDILVRLLYGARISLFVAFAATGAALLIGVPLGLVAGYYRGPVDAVISRAIDTALAFPSLLLGVGLAAVLGPGLLNVILVITIFSWYYPARIVRAAVLSLRSEQFIEAALSVGANDGQIIFWHLLPQLTAPIIVYATGIVANNIVFEAGLSYLGLGVPPPAASWGQMLSDGVANGLYRVQPWLAVIPGVILALTTLAFNQLGDGVRDALAPKGGG